MDMETEVQKRVKNLYKAHSKHELCPASKAMYAISSFISIMMEIIIIFQTCPCKCVPSHAKRDSENVINVIKVKDFEMQTLA